jgi:serine/threonine-protein kinase
MMTAAEVWDAACRWKDLGEPADPVTVLDGIVDPDRAASLVPTEASFSPTRSVPDTEVPAAALVTQVAAIGSDAAMRLAGPYVHVFDGLSLAAAPETEAARYAMGETLGEGGMGKVVAAVDLRIGRPVALKTLREAHRGSAAASRAFVDEARITGQLEHPNIIPIHELGVLPDGQPFYSMRIVKRRTLRDVLRGKTWPLARLCGVFVQACNAIGYAHTRGVLHRDIKPENILLGDYGEVYVADWGIAKLFKGPDVAAKAPGGSGGALGTPGYMAPEQILEDASRIDHRADLFALGVVLYTILTGRHPFTGSTSPDIMLNALSRDPVRPREIAPNCPVVLEELCLKLLSKDPNDRPSSAEAVAAEVEAFLEGAKERERRREEAARLVREASEPAARVAELERERDEAIARARGLLRDVRPWEPVERKRPAWDLEDRARTFDHEITMTVASAIELYTKALGYDPDFEGARAGLADLYWARA